MIAYILLEPLVNGTRLKCKGNHGELVKMLAEAIICHPGFKRVAFEAVSTAIHYMEKGGDSKIVDLKQNPVHPTDN